MGINNSNSKYSFTDHYYIIEDTFPSDNYYRLQSKLTDELFIGREINSIDKEDAHELQCIINQKLTNSSPFVTKLLNAQKNDEKSYCETNVKYYLLFREASKLLAQEIQQRRQRGIGFSIQQILTVIIRVSKGLKYLYQINHHHGNVSPYSITWPKSQLESIELIDDWALRNQNRLMKGVKNQSQNFEQRNTLYANDLYSLGAIAKQMLEMSPQAKNGEGPLNQELRKKIFLLMADNVTDRMQIYGGFGNRDRQFDGYKVTTTNTYLKSSQPQAPMNPNIPQQLQPELKSPLPQAPINKMAQQQPLRPISINSTPSRSLPPPPAQHSLLKNYNYNYSSSTNIINTTNTNTNNINTNTNINTNSNNNYNNNKSIGGGYQNYGQYSTNTLTNNTNNVTNTGIASKYTISATNNATNHNNTNNLSSNHVSFANSYQANLNTNTSNGKIGYNFTIGTANTLGKAQSMVNLSNPVGSHASTNANNNNFNFNYKNSTASISGLSSSIINPTTPSIKIGTTPTPTSTFNFSSSMGNPIKTPGNPSIITPITNTTVPMMSNMTNQNLSTSHLTTSNITPFLHSPLATVATANPTPLATTISTPYAHTNTFQPQTHSYSYTYDLPYTSTYASNNNYNYQYQYLKVDTPSIHSQSLLSQSPSLSPSPSQLPTPTFGNIPALFGSSYSYGDTGYSNAYSSTYPYTTPYSDVNTNTNTIINTNTDTNTYKDIITNTTTNTYLHTNPYTDNTNTNTNTNINTNASIYRQLDYGKDYSVGQFKYQSYKYQFDKYAHDDANMQKEKQQNQHNQKDKQKNNIGASGLSHGVISTISQNQGLGGLALGTASLRGSGLANSGINITHNPQNTGMLPTVSSNTVQQAQKQNAINWSPTFNSPQTNQQSSLYSFQDSSSSGNNPISSTLQSHPLNVPISPILPVSSMPINTISQNIMGNGNDNIQGYSYSYQSEYRYQNVNANGNGSGGTGNNLQDDGQVQDDINKIFIKYAYNEHHDLNHNVAPTTTPAKGNQIAISNYSSLNSNVVELMNKSGADDKGLFTSKDFFSQLHGFELKINQIERQSQSQRSSLNQNQNNKNSLKNSSTDVNALANPNGNINGIQVGNSFNYTQNSNFAKNNINIQDYAIYQKQKNSISEKMSQERRGSGQTEEKQKLDQFIIKKSVERVQLPKQFQRKSQQLQPRIFNSFSESQPTPSDKLTQDLNKIFSKYASESPSVPSAAVPSPQQQLTVTTSIPKPEFISLSLDPHFQPMRVSVIPQLSQQSEADNEDRQYVVQQYENGSRYEGEKYNGKRDGHGKFYYRQGSYYDGNWKENNMHGFGRLYYPNHKLAYEGDWFIDQFHGYGKVYNDEPMEIDGGFDYTNFDLLDQKWSSYEGTLVCDSKEGFGKLILANGEYYEGNFQGDRLHGEGKFVTFTGDVVSGIWEESKLVRVL